LSTEGTGLKWSGGILPPKILKLSAAQKCYILNIVGEIFPTKNNFGKGQNGKNIRAYKDFYSFLFYSTSARKIKYGRDGRIALWKC